VQGSVVWRRAPLPSPSLVGAVVTLCVLLPFCFSLRLFLWQYRHSNTPGSSPKWKGTAGTYNTDFNTNAGPVKTEHFDVYGEVQTKYSQVRGLRHRVVLAAPSRSARAARAWAHAAAPATC